MSFNTSVNTPLNVIKNPPFSSSFECEIDEKISNLQSLADFEQFKIESESEAALKYLFRSSEYCFRVCMQQPAYVKFLIDSDVLTMNYTYVNYRDLLNELIDAQIEKNKTLNKTLNEVDLSRLFRQFRNQQMLRITWRDIALNIDVKIILAELSYLADACINVGLEKTMMESVSTYGEPVDQNGVPMQLVVLAMGKLGAYELNYSSDIDLVFCYPEDGEINGRKNITHREFFTKLCRNFVRLLNDNTAYGFVYRVDTRLRPFGDSGQLALSFDAMENYYERHGREWERYAMIKARAISHDEKSAIEIIKRLNPFVYRRYLDFGAFESLREMKMLIDAELHKKGASKNIKLGPGGIREIEFIGQAFQLIRGGRTRELQTRAILDVLQILHQLTLIPHHVYEDLTAAYVFLRKVENAIQAYDDRQTHVVPDNELQQLRLAYAVGFNDWLSFETQLKSTMQTVHETFAQIFSAPQLQSFGNNADAKSMIIEQIWLGVADENVALNLLRDLGYADEKNALHLINSFRESSSYKRTSIQGQHRIDKLMPLIISSVTQSGVNGGNNSESNSESNSETANICLLRLISLIEAIARRSAYIALLAEHPMGLSQLVQLVEKSEWISNTLIQSPILLDELLDPRRLYVTIQKDVLEQELNTRLRMANDVEQQMQCLSEFKQSNVFRIAASELNGALPVNKISDQLTYIAEVVVAAVENISLNYLYKKYGQPKFLLKDECESASFCIIAYGKMGSIELGFSSDLDLVFLHDSEGEKQETVSSDVESVEKTGVDNSVFFARVAQRIMHFLSTTTQSGALYEVDTRLRPSGGAGILVSNLQSFEAYQHKKAWTWEHQSLIRARAVTGSTAIIQRFNQIRFDVLTLPRDIDTLRKEVAEMRNKMRQQLYKNKPGMSRVKVARNKEPNIEAFHIKQSVGGITDIEFIIQFLALAWANKYPAVIEHTDNLQIIDSLVKNAILCDEDAKILSTAYLAYRELAHINTLRNRSLNIVLDDEFKAHQQGVKKIWASFLE